MVSIHAGINQLDNRMINDPILNIIPKYKEDIMMDFE